MHLTVGSLAAVWLTIHLPPSAAGKTLLARAVANRTDACFIRVIGSELVQKYVGEGARMVSRDRDIKVGLCAISMLERAHAW